MTNRKTLAQAEAAAEDAASDTQERFAKTPTKDYFAVIFSTVLRDDVQGYEEMAAKILELGLQQPGCLGAEGARDATGFGITVTYWDSEESIAAWKAHAKHLVAQKMGQEHWYLHYELRVAKVTRSYCGPHGRWLDG